MILAPRVVPLMGRIWKMLFKRCSLTHHRPMTKNLPSVAISNGKCNSLKKSGIFPAFLWKVAHTIHIQLRTPRLGRFLHHTPYRVIQVQQKPVSGDIREEPPQSSFYSIKYSAQSKQSSYDEQWMKENNVLKRSIDIEDYKCRSLQRKTGGSPWTEQL